MEEAMAEPHVVYALRAKYAEIAGEIEACHKRLNALDASLDHVAASLRLFDPDAEPE
jgi:hypothetical protein